LVHGDGASAQGDWGFQIVVPGLAGALSQLHLDVPDGGVQVLDQEIEECCHTVRLHFGDDLECSLAPVKFINNFHVRHRPPFQMVGRIHTLPWMVTELVTRIYRQLVGRNINASCSVLVCAELWTVRAFSLDL
jgi:hypothetical protein